jgi:hypothetical protein
MKILLFLIFPKTAGPAFSSFAPAFYNCSFMGGRKGYTPNTSMCCMGRRGNSVKQLSGPILSITTGFEVQFKHK